MIKIKRLYLMGRHRFNIGFLDKGQSVALKYRVASRHLDSPNHSADMSMDDMLHLHGLHYSDLAALMDKLTLLHFNGDDGALHGRADGYHAFRIRQRHGGRSAPGIFLAIGEDGQRIGDIYLSSCALWLGSARGG